MNETDEFIIDAFKQQGLANDELIGEITAELDSQPENEVGDKDLALMNTLMERTGMPKQEIINYLSNELNMEAVDLEQMNLPDETLKLVTPEWARQYEVIPIGENGMEIEMVFANPLDHDALDNLSHLIGKSINPKFSYRGDVLAMIEQSYGNAEESKLNDFFEGMEGDDIEIGDGVKPEDVSEEDAPIIKYVHSVIKDALERRASDIHMEPLEKKFRVRFRIDGKLQEQPDPPKRLQPSIISRTKLMANVSLAEKRVPLDGRINVKVGDKYIDLRVSTLPTVHGESIVMRILDKEGLNLGLPQLGFFSDDQANFERVISLPDGVFLVTGPTGSGKSTTLYAALNYINHPDRKIITVEDPVEYEMSGVNQVHVKREVGMTFAAALRSMLRQAPNIIMVGEIRDKETAEIAINASLTGHMVFSTLHTNDAPSAVSRLVDIGIKPFLVSASIRSVLAQRLVRRICPKCKEGTQPEPRLLNSLGIRPDQISEATFMIGKGCEHCNKTGFRGRVGIFEMFNVNEDIQQMIYEEASLVALRERAREGGMRTMREDGIRKVLAGVTTPEEVLQTTVSD